jgi:hypothetical protein
MAEPKEVRGPAEENATRAEWREVHSVIDISVAQQRIERALGVELAVVARVGGVLIVRKGFEPRWLRVAGGWKADQRGEAGTPMVESRHCCEEQQH